MRSALRKVRKAAALPRADRALLIEAAAALPLIGLGLRVARLQTLLAGLASMAARWPQPGSPEPLDGVRRARRMLALAAWNHPYRGTCLTRSATLWWLLRRRGIRAELRIGVRKNAGALEGHAWVECDGRGISDRRQAHRHYTPFTETLTP